MLFQKSKIQNLKAIHNLLAHLWAVYVVVSEVKDTKLESNSQLCWTTPAALECCFRSQRYKTWKQFTTYCLVSKYRLQLFQKSKIQNLKAIHNKASVYLPTWFVVSEVKDTKLESNSQQLWKFDNVEMRCFRSQRYKTWKQFTTVFVFLYFIHSCFRSQRYKTWKQFTTNGCHNLTRNSCFRSQRYKTWKQFTTTFTEAYNKIPLFQKSKIQNLKAIHNTATTLSTV